MQIAMIYIPNNSKIPQTVTIPVASPLSGAFVFSLRSTVDRREVMTTSGTAGAKRLTVQVTATIPAGLPNGEYEYTLTQNGAAVDTGVAILGAWAREKQYHENIEFKQYGE